MEYKWVEFVLKLGSVAGAVTIVMKFSVDTYKKLITDPYNKKALELQNESSRMLKDALVPLNHTMERLNDLLADSKNDRKILHNKNAEQDKCLGDHSNRIVKLETWRDGHNHN